MWPTVEDWVFLWEIGERANWHRETHQRDLRWFRGLYE